MYVGDVSIVQTVDVWTPKVRKLQIAACVGTVVYNVLFAGFLLFPPIHGEAFIDIDNVLQAIGLLLFAFLCFVPLRAMRRAGIRGVSLLSPLLIGLGVFEEGFGQAIYTYMQHVMKINPPVPSVSDAIWLAIPPQEWSLVFFLSRLGA